MSSTIKNEPLVKRSKRPFSPKASQRVNELSDDNVNQVTLDTWHAKQHGEEHRYSQRRPYQNAKRAYQAAAELAKQKVTHQPFYIEDIGQAEETKTISYIHPESPSPTKQYMRPTRFYPDGGQNDRISRVQKVGRVQMQRIYPNYELSTAETRESGLGPRIEVLERYTMNKGQS